MGQKVNPHGLRVGVIKDWDSKWYANKKDFGDMLVEDYKIRKFLKKSLFSAGISKIEIERNDNKVRIHIHTAKPGVVIGKGGAMLKKVSSYARRDMETFFECKVNLSCWVKVKEDWRNRQGLIHTFGLD